MSVLWALTIVMEMPHVWTLQGALTVPATQGSVVVGGMGTAQVCDPSLTEFVPSHTAWRILADVNECTDLSTCHHNATCTNTIGSFECSCNSGFSGDGTIDCDGKFFPSYNYHVN